MLSMNRLAALLMFLATAAPLVLASPRPASAQIAPQAHGPVDVTADQLDVKNGECLASWRGDAEALQDTSRLRANTLNIYNKVLPKGAGSGAGSRNCGMLERMEADGDVYYVTPSQVVKGDHAVYTADTKTIVVTGNVVTTQGQNVIAGTRLVINTDTGLANMVSDEHGRGVPGRVRAVLYPNSAGSGAPASPAAKSNLRAPTPPPPRAHPQP
jgi:lipopolysaccharide export system protein LptA